MMTHTPSKHAFRTCGRLPLIAASMIALGASSACRKSSQTTTQTPPAPALFNLPAADEMGKIVPPDARFAALKPSERVETFDDALVRAKATGNDIVVLQRGSDWNRLSEHLYQTIWSQEPFLKNLGNGFIVLAVDNQENPGAPAVPLVYCSEGNIVTDSTPPRFVPNDYLTELSNNTAIVPACEIAELSSAEKVPYAKRPDGAWQISGLYAMPAADTLTVSMKATTGGKFLRLDFPTDPSLPANGPGLASNGNAVLAEVVVEQDGVAIPAESVTATVELGDQWKSARVIDGITEGVPDGWNMGGGKPVSLSISLATPVPPGATLTAKLFFRTPHAQHIAGCLRAAVVAAAPDLAQPPPASEVVAVTSEQKLIYNKRADGAFLSASKAVPSPATDILTLKLKSSSAGRVVRIDFPLDENITNSGPGRAGNFAISEIEASQGGVPFKAQAAWGNSGAANNLAAVTCINGIKDKVDEGWAANGGQKKARTLFLVLEKPLAVGDSELKLICKAQWAAHIPTCVKACLVDDEKLAATVVGYSRSEQQKIRNASYTWNDPTYCPRIALHDSTGRAIACENKPRIGLTPASTAALVHKLREVRVQRDEMWAKAEKAAGKEKAAFLAQGILLLRKNIGSLIGAGMWDGNNHCYKSVFDEIAKADPKDESWSSRVLLCGEDHRCGFAVVSPEMRKAGALDYFADAADAVKANATEKDQAAKDKNFQKAMAAYDAMIAHPNFQTLAPDLKQRVYHAKFTLYRSMPAHEPQAIEALKKIIAISADTIMGKAAIGLLANTFTEAPDNFAYGWNTKQLKAGENTFHFIRGLDVPISGPGSYLLNIRHAGGGDVVKVLHVALRDGDKVLAEATPADNQLASATPTLAIPITIKPADWKAADRKLNLILKLDAKSAKNLPTAESNGAFELVPVLMEEHTTPAANKKDYGAVLDALNESLMKNHDCGDPAVRLALAQREFIDACGPVRLNALQDLPGGAAMLENQMQDVDWMETFLTSGPPSGDFATSIENMRVLVHHCEGLEVPVYQRLATSIALSGGGMPFPVLIQTYHNYRDAHRNMMLYADFENLDVRSMRTAIDFCSKPVFDFLQDDRQLTIGAAFGACWAVWYMTDSIWGGSIHGGGYFNTPFWTPYNWFCGPYWMRIGGGVCGSCSTYGSFCSRVNGIQSYNVGQPGHCAYVIRVGKQWPVAYYIGGPTGCGVPGWPGISYNTANTLQEPVLQDRKAVLAAARNTWVAHLLRDAALPEVRLAPGFKYTLYQTRATAMPDFTKLRPVKSGESQTILPREIAPNAPWNEGFAAVWEGELVVAKDCDATVRFAARDEAHVFIGGQLIGGANATTPFTKVMPLKAGKHPFKVAYRHVGGRCDFDISFRPVPVVGDWQAAFDAAIRAQPTNYGTWSEYIAELKVAKGVRPETWTSLVESAASTFRDDQDAAWGIIAQCLQVIKPATKPDDLLKLFLKAHRFLPYSTKYASPGEGLNFAGVVAGQAAMLGDPALELKFFEQLLPLHFNPDPALNAYFGTLLAWGNGRFGKDPKCTKEYSMAVARFLKDNSAAVDKNFTRTTIEGGIRNASETGDLAAYRLWNALAKELLPPVETRWDAKTLDPVYQQYAQPFPGALLSPDGLLQCSSPMSYLSLRPIQDTAPGAFFYVNKMKNPWLTLQLGGESELSGIVLIGHGNTQMPLKFSVSADNKTWTEVATVTAYEPGIRIDLQGKAIKAKYVRVERPAECPDDHIHVRSFLVFGRKLY